MTRVDTMTTGSRAPCAMPGAAASPPAGSGTRRWAYAAASAGLAWVVTWAVVASAASWGWTGLAVTASWPAGLAAARHDLRTGRLPVRCTMLVGAAPAAFAAFAAIAAAAGGLQPAGAAAAGAAAMALPLAAVHVAVPEAMGFGDVKLATALGAGLGLVDWRLAVLGLAAGSAVAIVGAASQRRTEVPFGPGLLAGAALTAGVAATCALVGSPLLGWEVAGWR